ncbi:MAG: hypothetical protein ABSH28_09710 [Acidobacteriota bacterium]|jgi:hypothetical protein
MRWNVDWFAWEVSQALRVQKEYLTKMEDLLVDAQRKAREELDSAQGNLDWSDFSAQEQVYEIVYLREFPKDLRYSFIVLICVLLETRLSEACDKIQSRNQLPLRATALKRDILKQVKLYLKKVVGLDLNNTTWEKIDFVKAVRNCIVHAAGSVDKSRDAEKLKQGKNRWPGFQIDEDSNIMLEKEFSQFALSASEQLFDEIFQKGGFGPKEPIRAD